MTEPVGCWSGDLDESSTITRAQLGPVAPFSDSEIDKLYAKLIALEQHQESGQRSAEAELLVQKIRAAEEERAAEMSAFFARSGASIDAEEVQALLAKVDRAFGD